MAFVSMQIGLIRVVIIHVHPFYVEAVLAVDVPVQLHITHEPWRRVHIVAVNGNPDTQWRNIGFILVTRIAGYHFQRQVIC